MIGTVIDGSYRVDRLIGEGGFGVVYECCDLKLKRAVAMKVLRPGPLGDQELSRFAAEGQNLASLNHPNVVHIYSLGNFEDRPYIVMEYVQGTTLREIMARGRSPMRDMLGIMKQVASGLDAIHARGIVHRDLSPNNIMVTGDGTVKILDLGLSKMAHGLPSVELRGYLLGNLSYVAPEQIEGNRIGFPTEAFTFGVILYEALAGVHPFAAEHPMSLLYNITQSDPIPLRQRVPEVPERLGELVMRCVRKRPEERPASIREVETVLASVLDLPDVEISTPVPAAPPVPVSRASARNPYLNRMMIKHREDFFGRVLEIKRIYARLNATPPGSVSIVGERKIGKSSLLNYVYARSSRLQHLEQHDKTVMIFLDLQEQKNMSLESFVRTLLGIAEIELRGRLDIEGCALNLDGIKDLIQRLDQAGYRVVILLDEFDAVTTNPNFNLEFFSFLRFLANHYSVSYITSSARDLQVLCHTKEISDSPFFNIFSTMRLSVFQRGEAEELVRIPSERVGKPLAAYAGTIFDMAGLFPFFIQVACAHAIEYLDDHPDAKEPDFGEVRRRFYEEAKLHFRYVWDGLDDHERSTVVRVAKGNSMPDALQHVLTELQNRHYVESVPGSRPQLFSSTFDHFVRTEGAKQEKEPLLKRLFGPRP
jgi:AAA+ ATPase superfamily predicted ATPase/predicted Ser/Thr protein kinase